MRPLPLASLRVLEAVARLESFGRAAEELGMTQSAVSQHVRSLEDWIGQRLIQRGPRRSVATEEGARLATATADGVGQIDRVVRALQKQRKAERGVTILCPAGFAVTWLFPRLMNFDRDHPDIPVSVVTHPDEIPMANGGADLTILYASQHPKGALAVKLFTEQVVPVCAPSLQQGETRIVTASDLARHTLLLDIFDGSRTDAPDWAYWARQTGQPLPVPQRTRRFGQSSMTVQAAVQGEGVALGRSPLVNDALLSGKLVAPLPQTVPSRFGYWATSVPGSSEAGPTRELLAWVKGEAALTTLVVDTSQSEA